VPKLRISGAVPHSTPFCRHEVRRLQLCLTSVLNDRKSEHTCCTDIQSGSHLMTDRRCSLYVHEQHCDLHGFASISTLEQSRLMEADICQCCAAV
jgi:hypothetical protein